jgi:hypothetical protein
MNLDASCTPRKAFAIVTADAIQAKRREIEAIFF